MIVIIMMMMTMIIIIIMIIMIIIKTERGRVQAFGRNCRDLKLEKARGGEGKGREGKERGGNGWNEMVVVVVVVGALQELCRTVD